MSQWNNYFGKVLNSVFPRYCVDCAAPLTFSTLRHICDTCASNIIPIEQDLKSKCRICNAPVFSDTVEVCYDCFKHPPLFDQALSVLYYQQPAVRKLVHLFKFEYLKTAGSDLATIFKPYLPDILFSSKILKIPVPLAPLSLKKRGFNQVQLLLELLDIPFTTNILGRKDHKIAQSTLSREQRMRSVQSQFYIFPNAKELIRDQIILLIDDIYTTGSTARALSRILMENKAKKVIVFTFLRD